MDQDYPAPPPELVQQRWEEAMQHWTSQSIALAIAAHWADDAERHPNCQRQGT
jgi:hypothetical protein